MNVAGRPYRTIWPSADGNAVEIIDQTRLPHALTVVRLSTLADAAHAIRAMLVRGAPLIGATAAWGLWLALRADASDTNLAHAHATLQATRPTAINLRWALDRVRTRVSSIHPSLRADAARQLAIGLADEDVELNRGSRMVCMRFRSKSVPPPRSLISPASFLTAGSSRSSLHLRGAPPPTRHSTSLPHDSSPA